MSIYFFIWKHIWTIWNSFLVEISCFIIQQQQRDFTADFQHKIQVCRAPPPSQKEVFPMTVMEVTENNTYKARMFEDTQWLFRIHRQSPSIYRNHETGRCSKPSDQWVYPGRHSGWISQQEQSGGYEDGHESGYKDGLATGIKALIQTCQDLLLSRQEAEKIVRERFALSDEEAHKLIQKYWISDEG